MYGIIIKLHDFKYTVNFGVYNKILSIHLMAPHLQSCLNENRCIKYADGEIQNLQYFKITYKTKDNVKYVHNWIATYGHEGNDLKALTSTILKPKHVVCVLLH